MKTGGRKNRGDKNPNSQLRETEVRVIKQELLKGVSARAISELYMVSTETIRRIGRGETWAWVEWNDSPAIRAQAARDTETRIAEDPLPRGLDDAELSQRAAAAQARFAAMLERGEIEQPSGLAKLQAVAKEVLKNDPDQIVKELGRIPLDPLSGGEEI